MDGMTATGRLKTDLLVLKRYAAPLLIALTVFLVDLLSSLPGAVAVLFTAVVLLVGRDGDRRLIILTGAVCALLTLVAFALSYWGKAWSDAHMRLFVSLAAITVTTLLAVRARSAESDFALQARLLDLTHDTVIIHDDHLISYWNDGAAALYGYSREEALGGRCRDLLQTRLPIPKPEIDRIIAAEGVWCGDITRTRADGALVDLHTRWTAGRRENGKVRQIIETSTDVTEQRRLDLRYQGIFNAAGFAIWEADWSRLRPVVKDLSASGVADVETYVLDRPELIKRLLEDVVVTDINEAALKLFGDLRREDVVGTNFSHIVTPATEQAFARILGLLDAGADRAELETRYRTLAGHSVEALIRLSIPEDSLETWSRVLVTTVDLTERNRMQARLDQTLAELSHGSRISMLGQMAASIAHEVNQPLAAVVTFGEAGRRWLAREPFEIEELSYCMEQILSNGRRATDVINRVRSLASQTPPQAARLSVAAIAVEAAALMSRELRTQAVLYREDIEEHLPEISGDRVQLQQVVINLLMNAVQALALKPEGERALTLAVFRTDADHVSIEVRDTGPGISPEQADRMFQSFATTKSEGLGLGLSISRSIIEAHRGRLNVADNSDGGATAVVVLPVA